MRGGVRVRRSGNPVTGEHAVDRVRLREPAFRRTHATATTTCRAPMPGCRSNINTAFAM